MSRFVEKRIAEQCARDLIAAGFTVVVDDGEEWSKPFATAKEIVEAMFSTDEDFLIPYKDGKKQGWVRFIYGNDGPDVINDYTVNLEPVLAKTFALADKFEE
jgi:hypothetical protein